MTIPGYLSGCGSVSHSQSRRVLKITRPDGVILCSLTNQQPPESEESSSHWLRDQGSGAYGGKSSGLGPVVAP
jgi:hypothetical protein